MRTRLSEKWAMGDKVRRIVTGHDRKGSAVFVGDQDFETVLISAGDARMTTIWATAEVPADLNNPTEGRERPSGTTLMGGSVIRVVDMLPEASSPMHRSSSIDYGIVVRGEIELELDDGKTKVIGPGGVIVQRGTIHRWRNPSRKDTCRIVFILIEAMPFELDGKPLEDVMKD